ncbi:MAG TPA: filamentous hemagglutinin N-terminal domain-containing protein [Waterburya sp.]
MTRKWHSKCWKFGLASAFLLSGVFACGGNRTLAQTIVPDATLGAERSIVTSGVDAGGVPIDRIDGGATRGVNLFHSFIEFNVGNGRAAYFANPAAIENILSRVTGTNPSNILGKLGVLGKANLFVINPNGILFGPNAQLDIRGSFFASTASSFKFSDGSEFSASNPTAPPLLTINVTPGLQWGTSQLGANITNRGKLAVGQDLTLVADQLDLQGQLQAGRDLTLLAQDTVKVREVVATPFLARSGRNLTIQGKGGIDILALNHPTQTPFVSGGNLSLISDGIISGDARFRSGGSFSIKSVSGGLANFVSYYDPIISSTGDVDVAANYTGTSLLVETQGNIRFQGDINITGPDTSTLPAGLDTATLSSSSALIMRSGQSTPAYGGVNSGAVPVYGTGGVPEGITIGGNAIVQPFNGAGGIVTLSAASGNVSTRLISTNGQQTSWSVNDTNGGAISLEATNGSINTGSLFSYSYSRESTAGNGGAISLVAANSINITNNQLDSSSSSSYGSGGNGGAISLFAANGINITSDLFSYSYSTYGTTGNGGAISLVANSINITNDQLNSSSSSSYGSGGNGGTISLVTANGINITGNSDITGFLNSSSSSSYGNAGNGGAISLFAASGSIYTKYLGSYSSSAAGNAGNGGAINLVAANGSIHSSSLDSFSYSSFGNAAQGGTISLVAANDINITGSLRSLSESLLGNAAQGGNINLFATNTIQLFREEYDLNTRTYKRLPGNLINSTGELGSGNISIVSNAPLALDNSVISSDTFGSGRGGDIHISAESISLTGGAQLSASTHSSGAGGNITLVTSDSVELGGATTKVPVGIFNQAGFATIPAGTFLGGFIPTGKVPIGQFGRPEFPPGTRFPSGVFTQTTANSTGSTGNIRIETGRLIIKDGAAIATTLWGKSSNASNTNISVEAKDSISITNGGSILSGVAGGARGNSGSIELITPSLSLTQGGFVQTQTLGEGNAGNIQAIAHAVNLSGAGSDLRSGSGGSNELLGTTGSNIGQGGNISITTGSLSLDDRAVLDAQTLTNSRGGDITVNANTLSASNGGRLLTSTSGGGQAGDITVSAKQIQLSGSNSGLFAQTSSAASAGNLRLQPLGEGQTLRVNFWDGAQISASTLGSGRGGNLTITAPESINLTGNGSIISAETSGSGTGGDLTLKTGTLTVRDEAKVTVSSTGTGDAGNLNVSANSVLLDNGELIAQTASGEGGNIYLKVDDLLLMRNNSLISAQAGNNGNGGNIDIDARLIVAVPKEDSDIVADAFRGNGGNINITTSGIFGLEYRQERTSESDITASSRFGISGTVNIARLVTDPSQGLTNLPSEVVDASSQMAQNCRAGATAASEQSSFVVTGRGGLPPNPQEALSPDAVEVDLVRRNAEGENRSRRDVSTNSTYQASTRLAEAQGWVMGNNGEVILTATAPTVTPHSPWQGIADCQKRDRKPDNSVDIAH